MCLAVPGQIIEVVSEGELDRCGKVSFGGVVRMVNLAFVPDAGLGDWVVVHIGYALDKIDEAEALESLEYFRQIQELEEQISPSVKGGFDGYIQ
ncbi:MAG: HypC/HybG/HupF family hydrogenase formation chaperone [Calditrichaeota bacterium]|nr:HypC/HybG/HupF family hydrogenase formation chaperone [Calditrichota bacterium]